MNSVKMMVPGEDTIKSLNNELLRLKLKLHQQEKLLNQKGVDPDETNRDLIAGLMSTNEELTRRIEELESREEPERPQMSDAACQTNIDRINIEQLLEASVSLKKLKQQQLLQQEQLIQQRHFQQQQPPNHPPIQSVDRMTPDEKDSLDKLFKLDGLLTTARNKLRVVLN